MYYFSLLLFYCRSETETEIVKISVTNGDLIATDKEVIHVEHSVSNYSVTVLARDAGHAVVNISLMDTENDGYCVSCYLMKLFHNYSTVFSHAFHIFNL
jgi:hypothetical protein